MKDAAEDPNISKGDIDRLFERGKIGGRQIKCFFDRKDRLILFSDTDEKRLSQAEQKQFAPFHYTIFYRCCRWFFLFVSFFFYRCCRWFFFFVSFFEGQSKHTEGVCIKCFSKMIVRQCPICREVTKKHL